MSPPSTVTVANDRELAATTASSQALTNDDADMSMHEPSDVPSDPSDHIREHYDEFMESEQSENDSVDMETQADEEPSILQMQKAAAKFLLTLKEQHRLTQVAVNFLVSQVKEIIECIVKEVKTMVAKALLENSFVSANDDLQYLDKCYENTNPFMGLETKYRQKKFYKTHFNLVSINKNRCGTIITFVINAGTSDCKVG